MGMQLDKKEQEAVVNKHKEELWKRLGFTKEDFSGRERKQRDLFAAIENDIWENATPDNKPSVILKKNYQMVMDAYVGKEKQEELLYIIDKSCKFMCTEGYGRRTVRTAYDWYINDWTLSGIFNGYYNLNLYGKNMVEYFENVEYRIALKNLLSYNCPELRSAGYLIAAELDKGNTKLAETLEDILMSENNTNIVTREIIDGIVKSDNQHLHKVLGDFLLAAKLQEGVRQVICETMDHGTVEAFLTLFKVITDNDLIRYSAVKRAICVWTGICSEEHMERITGKQLAIMAKALEDKAYLEELLQSNDSIELYMGLWVQGFYEVEDAIATCQRLIAEGTKNQRLVVSYYNIALQRPKLCGRAANYVLEHFPEDAELCAAFLPTYMPNLTNVAFEALYGKREQPYYYASDRTCKYHPVSYEVYFENEAQARKHFELLKQLRNAVPKKGHNWSPCIFPWYNVSIHPSDVLENLAMIAYMTQDNALIDEACVLLPEMKDIYERYRYLRLLVHEPKTPVQRKALLDALADKGADVRREAFEMVGALTLTEADYEEIRGCLKYKAADIRKNTLSLLEKQSDDALMNTIEAALQDKKEEVRLGGLDLVVRLKKDAKRQKLYQDCLVLLRNMEKVSEKEAVIISELTGDSQADSVLNERGYGLYNPDAAWNLPECQVDTGLVSRFMKKSSKADLVKLLEKLDDLYEANKDREYQTVWGVEKLLGENFLIIQYGTFEDSLEKYPFPELWRGFYEEHIKDFETLVRLNAFSELYTNNIHVYDRGKLNWFAEPLCELLGEDYVKADTTFKFKHVHIFYVVQALFSSYAAKEENQRILKELGYSLLAAFAELPKEKGIHIEKTTYAGEQKHYITTCAGLKTFTDKTKSWSCQEDFDRMFLLCHKLNMYYEANATD